MTLHLHHTHTTTTTTPPHNTTPSAPPLHHTPQHYTLSTTTSPNPRSATSNPPTNTTCTPAGWGWWGGGARLLSYKEMSPSKETFTASWSGGDLQKNAAGFWVKKSRKKISPAQTLTPSPWGRDAGAGMSTLPQGLAVLKIRKKPPKTSLTSLLFE